jgi:hypothetical protein
MAKRKRPRKNREPNWITRLPFPPPFSKDEWSKSRLSAIVDNPVYFGYFERCMRDIVGIYEDGPFHAAINDKLASVATTSPSAPSWYEAWQRLSPQSSQVERLAVYRAVRRDGCLPLEAGFYLVAWQADVIAFERAEIELRELDDQMAAIMQAHGLDDDDFWTPEDEPPEYRQLRERHRAAWDQIFVDTLVGCGEGDMAEQFQHDHEEFDRLLEAGRRFFHGETPADDLQASDWLEELIGQIAESMEFHSPDGPLGYRYGGEDGFWEVAVYPTPVEIVGGADDGDRLFLFGDRLLERASSSSSCAVCAAASCAAAAADWRFDLSPRATPHATVRSKHGRPGCRRGIGGEAKSAGASSRQWIRAMCEAR